MARQYFDFEGKVVLVTGGSRGLGRAICVAFAEQGAEPIIASRNEDACKTLAEEITQQTGRSAMGIGTHVGRWDDLERLVEAAYDRFGKVDVLVNNAGMSPIAPSSEQTSEELFDKVIGVNLKGPYRLSALIGSRMAAGAGGSIINVSSLGSIRPMPLYAPYAAAKAALNAITIAHAHEFGPSVRVNGILPGSFKTDIAKSWDPDREKTLVSALGRYAEPDEIVSTVLYLASDLSSFTTGALIRVDGGRP